MRTKNVREKIGQPSGDHLLSVDSFRFVDAAPEFTRRLALGRLRKSLTDRQQPVSPPAQIVPAQMIDAAQNPPPVLDRTGEGDGRNAADAINPIIKEPLKRIHHHDLT